MKIEKIALLAEIVGGAAIVITLIVLIVELRGNTNALQIATIDNVTTGWVGLNETVITNPQVARVLITGLYSPDSLSTVEAAQFSMWLRAFANQVDRVLQQYELGFITDENRSQALHQLAWLWETPGGRQYWESAPNAEVIWGELLQPYWGLPPPADLILGRDPATIE